MASESSEAADSPRRWVTTACLAGALAGIVLAVVGAVWKSSTTPETFWSREQAVEYQAASEALHAASGGHVGEAEHAGHDHGADASEDGSLAAARARFDRIQADLEQARFARDRIGPLLIQIGLAAAIAFGIGYWASQSSE